MTLRVLEQSQRVAAPLDEVFPFFARPENLAEITPENLAFEVTSPPTTTNPVLTMVSTATRDRGSWAR